MRVPSSTRSVSSPTAALPSQPRPTWQRPCRFVGFRTRSVPISFPLFLFIFLSITIMITPSRCVVTSGCDPALLRLFSWRSPNGACVPALRFACRAPHRDSCFRTPHSWIPLLKMVVTGGRQREYGDLSYHHIVLGLGEVDHLHIVTRQRSPAYVASPPPSFFVPRAGR
jgi:hypothetical protein